MATQDDFFELETVNNVILFDGVCKLCHAWARFIIAFDKANTFKLASVQSPEGTAITDHYQLLPSNTVNIQYDTLYFLAKGRVYKKSTAVLHILAAMPYPWRIASIFRLIPLAIRDFLYDQLAKYRYTLFGKYKQCRLPSTNDKQRFLTFKKSAG
ncbi:Uncharacterised protein [Zhongshania aliphaticivorans]|uniref:Thiol-disulfide oxidoreductase n=1 Tax=Zhongshania aliphaticivorans TaxID=1470434 RepID=A0A5S9QB30_9GAMM|nr:DCC1-like thiol-disulfide oxidoreductase family protein [Zhongshania aliphaticivorans]CAA0087682.1 Uncharacterised protein [Zhongshania aliphaticivorans]CAA0115313.1 Uncharacterised protein [Zhongshania aliphaticivorans]CAA0120145.1 Uncharacterised protein [Zhongshania aliphaticivorans]